VRLSIVQNFNKSGKESQNLREEVYWLQRTPTKSEDDVMPEIEDTG
jgi:hypothetical protein